MALILKIPSLILYRYKIYFLSASSTMYVSKMFFQFWKKCLCADCFCFVCYYISFSDSCIACSMRLILPFILTKIFNIAKRAVNQMFITHMNLRYQLCPFRSEFFSAIAAYKSMSALHYCNYCNYCNYYQNKSDPEHNIHDYSPLTSYLIFSY